MSSTVLITGITGQDGSYLAEMLSAEGKKVVGTTRTTNVDYVRLPGELASHVRLASWDLIDRERFAAILLEYRPTEIYNFAAFTSGEHMDREPDRVSDINGLAVLRILETIREIDPAIRFCQASSSEVFAASGVSPQNEQTPRSPRSIYGAAKIYADNIIALYRQKHGLFACSAILFNHESPRRGDGFVTKKIVRAAVEIKKGRQRKLALGNLAAARDWGFAGDYVRAMALMLRAAEPTDYVIATGVAHTVADFCERAFAALSLNYRDYVKVDPAFYRPAEAAPIVGDASLAATQLDWQPQTSFDDLVKNMIDFELAANRII